MQASPKIVTLEAARALKGPGGVVKCLAVGADTGGAYALQQGETQPGEGPPLHRHSREDEGFLVLAGEYEFLVGEQKFKAGPGTFIFGPRGIAHRLKCLGPGPGKIQVIISPPGFEAFFEEADALVRQGPPEFGQIIALAAKYGVEILGPPQD